MSQRILQINLKFNVSAAEYEQTVSAMAEGIAAVEGLRWKVWLMNEAESEAGGIYLFDNAEAAQAFLDGPIVSQVAGHPAITAVSAKQFEISEAVTAITRGPVGEMVSA